MRRRYLIIGASGFIGSHLYRRLGPERAVATYCGTPVAGGVYFDAAGAAPIAHALPRGRREVTHAFLLQGVGSLNACARDPQGTGRTNVEGMIRVIDQLGAMGAKLLFPSSDAVFDGSPGTWTETSATHPVLTYGKQKLAVERHLAASPAASIIARLSKVVGADPGPHSLFGEWIEAIERGTPIRCARDLVFAPIHVEDVVSAFIALADSNLTGVFNVCGPRPMSRLELLELFLAEVRRHRHVANEIVPCSIRDFPFLEPRPLNGAMRPEKLRAALGLRFEDMESVCCRIAAQAFGPRAAASSA